MVGTMIVGYLAGASAATVAASFALTAAAFAVNFAVSMIVTRIFADNPESQQDMGVRQQVPPSAVNAIPVVYGEAYMGGTFVDAVLTTDQRKMYYVLAISSISPNGQFTFDQTEMYYGDQKIIFDGTEPGKVASLSDEATPTPNLNTKIAGNLFIYLFTSNQAGTITAINSSGSLPSTIMGGSDIQASQRWTGTRQMNGTAFAIVVLNYNREADTTGLQPITFKVKHALNGTGVAKPGDVWYDYITNPVYGGAVDTAFVDSTCVTTLNAYSDATITFDDYDGNPQTQARYRINGVLDAGQSVLSNIDRIMSACDSWMSYNAALGQWSVVVNKAETTSYAFDDDNIIGEIRVSATDITSSINQVEARFPFKENRDQAAFVNLELQTLNPSLLYPNEPVNKYSITYDLVNDSVQANYLANRLLEQGREDLIVSFSTTYYGIQVNAGDVVSVTNSDYGWSAKLFRVMKVNEASLPDGSLGAKLELNEYSAAVYDNFDITQYSPVPNSGLPSATYFSPLSAPTVTGYPTATVPHFDVQVYVPATGRVTYGNLFYTTSATPTASDWKLLATASTANSEPVTNGTYYNFANQTLPTGTYYFAYMVGNDVSQSILSPISSSFAFSPTGGTTGPTGPTGTTGLNSATVYLYNKNTSTTPPSLFSGTFTYTFATGVLSGGTLNGWSQTPPAVAAGEFLFLSLATASSTSSTDTIPYTEFSTPEVISGTGTNGANTAIVSLFNKNTSASTPPTTFSGTFTYTFATAVLSGGTLNGWSQSAPTLATGEYLWQRQATAFSTTATDTIAATEFSSAVVSGAYGPTGPAGASITGPSGLAGLTALTAYKVQSQSASTPTFTTPTTGATAPTGWSLTTPSVAVGQVLWYIMGRYNSNSVTVDGVAAGQTAWTGPVAASVFQDIRSDNWNGSSPPTLDPNTPSTWGTAGYYIQQSTGYMFLNSVFGRGSAKFDGSFASTTLTTAMEANASLNSASGLVAYSTTTNPLGGAIRAYNSSSTGGGQAIYGRHGASTGGVAIYGYNAGTSGYGVYGNGPTGIYGLGSIGVLGAAVYASGNIGGQFSNLYPSGIALDVPNGTVRYGGITISVPPNTTTTWLRGDGTFTTVDAASLGGYAASSWARIFVGDSGTANAAGSGMNFNCTISGYQFAGSGNTLTLQPISDRRLKENIAPETLGLSFVNSLIPVTYNLIGQQRKSHGFIAQDIETLIADANDSLKIENADGMKGVDYMSLIAPLVKAVQELTKRIEELEKA